MIGIDAVPSVSFFGCKGKVRDCCAKGPRSTMRLVFSALSQTRYLDIINPNPVYLQAADLAYQVG